MRFRVLTDVYANENDIAEAISAPASLRVVVP